MIGADGFPGDCETGALVATKQVHGKCEQIAVNVSVNSNTVTATVTITNADGAVLYTKGGIAASGSPSIPRIYQASGLQGTTDADFAAFFADEICTITVTPSGDPGATGVDVDVAIYVDPLR